MPTRWHCLHCLFCSPVRKFKSHTSHCGEAVLGRAACKYVGRVQVPVYFCDRCVQFFPDVEGICRILGIPSLHPPCSECVCHHTSSAISTQFPAQRAQLTIEICGMFITGVMTLQRLQVLACSYHNRYSSHVLLTVISIYPDGLVSWLPLVSSTCLRNPTPVSSDMTRKPSANAPSTTTHPEELIEIYLIFSKYELFAWVNVFFCGLSGTWEQIKREHCDVFSCSFPWTGNCWVTAVAPPLSTFTLSQSKRIITSFSNSLVFICFSYASYYYSAFLSNREIKNRWKTETHKTDVLKYLYDSWHYNKNRRGGDLCSKFVFLFFILFIFCFFEAKCDFRKPLVTEGSAGGRSGSSRTCIWDTKMSMYCMYFSVFLYIHVFLSSVPLNYIRPLNDKKNYVSRNQAFYGGRGERW